MATRLRKSATGPVDADDRVVADKYCLRCGMNLRGFSVYEPCPECCHPISDSVYGDYLIYSHPAEIRRLDDAATMVIYGAMLTVSIIAVALMASMFGTQGLVHAVDRAFDVLLAGAIISPVVATTGIALLTRRHSPAYYRAKYSHGRALAQALASLLGAAIAVALAAYYLGWVVKNCILVAWAVIPCAMFCKGLARLMYAMPNKKLGMYATATFVTSILLGIGTLIVRLTRTQVLDNPDWEGPVLALMFVVVLGGVGFVIAGTRLLFLVRRAIRSAGGV